MADYAIEIKVRNGRLLRAMRDAGFKNARALAIASGVSQNVVGKYLMLKLPPLREDGEVRPSVFSICRVLGKSIEELFPEQHMATPLAKSRAELFCDIADLERLCGEDYGATDALQAVEDRVDAEKEVRRLLPRLSKRRHDIIERRYGLDGNGGATLWEIAKEIDVTAERVRGLEQHALRTMRQPRVERSEGKCR